MTQTQKLFDLFGNAASVMQYDLLGNVEAAKQNTAKRRPVTMQEMHGTKETSLCRDCAHLVKFNHGSAVYKCLKWKFTPDPQSDMDAEQAACGKFKLY